LSLRHLRPVERIARRGKKFAAVQPDVAHVLGPHRGASLIYGFLASSWFEFASPSDTIAGKKRPSPGDWIEVDYRQLMEISGTNGKASIIRWLRILAEDVHPCLEGRCAGEHPLIVIHRQGQNRPNRYRKWRCGEDELGLRRRIQSQKLSESARRRVAAGEHLNGIFQARPSADSPAEIEPQLGLDLSEAESRKFHYKTSAPAAPGSFTTRLPDETRKFHHETSERASEVPSRDGRKFHHETSLYGIENIENLTAAEKSRAAAIGEQAADDVDAVACEVVDAILELAKRTEPEYTDDRAWSTARRLANAALKMTQGEAVAARSLLLRAIADRRLARAGNPVGLLIRGVEGDAAGADRFLVSRRRETDADGGLTNSTAAPSALDDLAPGMREMLLEAVRSGTAIDARWMRGRDIPPAAFEAARESTAEEAGAKSETPLCDELAARDGTEYRRRLEEILAGLEVPVNLGVRRTLDHPMLLGMCRARLERELCGDR
jgi:hypothetical protein